MVFTRSALNPVITPRLAKPSRPDFEVIGTFNTGVTQVQDEVVLLVRVAERPIASDPSRVLFPHMTASGDVVVRSVMKDDPRYDLRDARLIQDKETGAIFLTSVSHLRLARSRDGVTFSLDDTPWLCAEPPYENYGIEDARITKIGETYYVNYSAVSRLGISTGLVSTTDFGQIQRLGVIFAPANRDVVIFPEQINGLYMCYHRPMPSPLGELNIWSATSPDLRHWGNHQLVLQVTSNGWESGRVGGGAPPLKTRAGWLSIYHAADKHDHYCLGAFLTPFDQPTRIIARSLLPILSPQAPYETNGFFGNVVFTCGALLRDDRIVVYYGAADETIGVAEASVDELLGLLSPQP